MKTWKNRQRHHRKTRSRKQRGGVLTPSEQTELTTLKGLERLNKLPANRRDRLITLRDKLAEPAPAAPPPLAPLPPAAAPLPPLPPAAPPSPPAPAAELPPLPPAAAPSSPLPPLPPAAASAPTELFDAIAADPYADVSGLKSSGIPVYNVTGRAPGKARSVAQCDAELAQARARIVELEGKLGADKAKMDAHREANDEYIAKLNKEVGALNELLASNAKLQAALNGDIESIAGQLEAHEKLLRDQEGAHEAEIAELQGINARLTDENGEKDAALADLQEQLAASEASLRDQLEAKEDEIAALKAAHAQEVAALRADYTGQLRDLQRELDRVRVEKDASAAEKRHVDEEKVELEARIRALDGAVAGLTRDLQETQAAAAAAAETARADAERATAAAAAAAAAAEAEKGNLRARIAAGEAALAAAQDAVARTNELLRASREIASRLADESVETQRQARVAREQANAEIGRRGISEAQRNAAAARADAAERAAEAHRGAAERAAAEAAAAAAAQVAAQAEAGRLRLFVNSLRDSTPLIRSMTNPAGAEVGGDAGVGLNYGETVTVTWEEGAQNFGAWVFVIFINHQPVFSKLLLRYEPFEFQSEVEGDISAAIFNVRLHSRDALLGRII